MPISFISRHFFIRRQGGPFLSAGFTLIELLVTVSVMLVVMSIVLYGQSTYTNSTSVGISAQDLSLSYREAQVYGVSVKEVVPGSNEFSASYGVMVQKVGLAGYYYYFADRGVKNGMYDNDSSCPIGGSSECLKKVTIDGGNTISDLCAITGSGDICGLGRIDTTFTRPNTDAAFVFFDGSITRETIPGATGIKVKITSPLGLTKTVSVYVSGQISVQ